MNLVQRMGECYNCEAPAASSYTLVFDTGVTLRDRVLCFDCFSFFSASDAIEVRHAPAIPHGTETIEE